jgi:hypothetical protein
MRILSELEEAGHENLPTIINTVMEPSGGDDERNQIRDALVGLVSADLVQMALNRGSADGLESLSKDQSLALLAGIDEHLRFKSGAGHWTGGQRPWPEVMNTEAGNEKAFEILNERGYQWWRQSEQ